MNSAVTGQDPRATTPISDLSETGVFVHTDEPLGIDSEIELRFTVQLDEPILFEGVGRVVRVSREEPVGMGVEFVDLDDSGRDVIRKILLRAEAARSRTKPPLARTDPHLRTHGLVAKVRE